MRFLIKISLLFALFQIQAQQVFTTTGGEGMAGNTTLSYTIGEPITTTINSTLTQGFQQPSSIDCPQETISQSGTAICSNNGLRLSVINGFLNYQWYVDGARIVGDTNSSIMPVIEGDYYVAFDNGFCAGYSDTVTVTLDPSFQIPSVIENPIGTLVSDINNNVIAYQWYVDVLGERYAIVGETGAAYQPIYNATYYVNMGYQSGCAVLSNPYTFFDAGNLELRQEFIQLRGAEVIIHSAQLDGEMLVYPNPAGEIITLDLISENEGWVHAKVFSLEGYLSLEKSFYKKEDLFSQSISLGALNPGVYHLEVMKADKLYTKKIIVLK